MAKPLKEDPEPEPEPEPEPDPDEDAAWNRATPRLKGLFRETLDEWLAEIADSDTENDQEGEEAEPKKQLANGGGLAASRGGGDNGRAAKLGGVVGAAKTPRAPRPSGGSFLETLIGR